MTIPVSVQFHPSTRAQAENHGSVYIRQRAHTYRALWLCRCKRLHAVIAQSSRSHRDLVRKQQYLARHAPREDWDNPMTAGALARWILWNKETLPSSIEDYTRRFGLAAV